MNDLIDFKALLEAVSAALEGIAPPDSKVLFMSGIVGAIFSAVIAPKGQLGKTVVHGVCGVLSAVYLGGAVTDILKIFMEVGPDTKHAVGFLLGTSGQYTVIRLQEYIDWIAKHKRLKNK